MKKLILLTAVLSVYYFLTACAMAKNYSPASNASRAENKAALQFPHSTDYANLYILDLHAINVGLDVKVGDKNLGVLERNQFFNVKAEPGSHNVLIKRKGNSDMGVFAVFNMSVEAGEPVLIVCSQNSWGEFIQPGEPYFAGCNGSNYREVHGISACYAPWENNDNPFSTESSKTFCAPVSNRDYFFKADLARSNHNFIEVGEEAAYKKAKELNTIEAYQSFLGKHSGSQYSQEISGLLEPMLLEQKQQQNEAKISSILQRDSPLPTQVAKDKYMVNLTNNLKNQQFEEALLYFNLLARLNVPLPGSMDYFWGESLLRTGDPEKAREKLYAYIQKEGAQGKYYTKALQLASEAEAQLE